MKNKIIGLLALILLIGIIFFSLKFQKTYSMKVESFKLNIENYNNLIQTKQKLDNKINKQLKKYKNNKINLDKLTIKKDNLEEKLSETQIKENNKVIYLTFDDGPSIYTLEILEILKKYNIKATFFVVCHKKLPEYSKKYIENGHTIGLHSCSHKYNNIYSNEEAYFNDLNMLSTIIEDSSGYKSKYVRFPGGSSNIVSKFNKGIMTRLSNMLKDRGYKYYDWTIDSNDAGGANSDQIYSNVIGSLENNNRDISMVLMHDTKSSTKDVLEKIIKKALEMGYTFDSIKDYTKEVHHYINN